MATTDVDTTAIAIGAGLGALIGVLVGLPLGGIPVAIGMATLATIIASLLILALRQRRQQ